MPVISPQDRPVPVADESAYRAPKRTVNVSTGMDLKQSLSGASQEENRQPEKVEETQIAPKEVTLSPQLTALARREAKFRAQEQAFKAREQAVAAKEAEFGKLTELKSKLAAKDYSVLDELVDYNEYSNHVIAKLNGSDPKDEAIKNLETKLNSFEEQQKQNVTKQYEATVNQYRRDIKNLVESDPAYDSIKAQKAEEHVLQHILDTFNEDGEILTVDQAAKEVEEAILEEAEEYLKLSKIQSKIKPQVEEKKLPPPRTGLRTLTNQVIQTAPAAPRNQFQHLSPKERIAQAIARASKPQG